MPEPMTLVRFADTLRQLAEDADEENMRGLEEDRADNFLLRGEAGGLRKAAERVDALAAAHSRVVIDVLNSAFENDPAAVHALICNRVPCNQQLADHPTIVVGPSPIRGEHYSVAALGLLNGVLGSLGLPLAAARFSEPDAEGRRQVLGFQVYDPPSEQA